MVSADAGLSRDLPSSSALGEVVLLALVLE